MRRLTFVAIGLVVGLLGNDAVAIGLVVLTTAGIAVAKGLDNAKTVTSVSGTFDAATVQHRGKARTCTSAG